MNCCGVKKLCKHLGEENNNLFWAIGELFENGLPREIQQMLDIVRITGNESVHLRELDNRDNQETVQPLFTLINWIIEDRITRPNSIQENYGSISADKRKAIDEREEKLKGKKPENK